MKRLKMLGPVVIVLAGCIAFAGNASANPVLTSPAGTAYTGEITETLEGSLLTKAGFSNTTCTSVTRTWVVETNNTTAASGKEFSTSFGGCGGVTVVVISKGSLKVTPGGTMSGSGSETTTAVFGTSCVYGTKAGTTLGTVKGGSPAKMALYAEMPLVSGGFGCANPAMVSGNFTITKPTTLLVD